MSAAHVVEVDVDAVGECVATAAVRYSSPFTSGGPPTLALTRAVSSSESSFKIASLASRIRFDS